jgi:hypothetical protein
MAFFANIMCDFFLFIYFCKLMKSFIKDFLKMFFKKIIINKHLQVMAHTHMLFD